MKSVTTFDNFPTFAENGSRNMNTESAKYQIGFMEADTFPAEWANYFFHGATKGVSDLNTAVQSIWQENIKVITQSGQTPNPNSTNQLYTAIQIFINNAILSANASVLAQAKLDAHPVGSLYWSSDPTDPSILFGGTWVRIKDRFVLAVGDTYGNGATGGSATVKLTESNLPAHSHTCSSTSTDHVHGYDHKHDFSTGEMSGNSNGWFNMSNRAGVVPNVDSSNAVDKTRFKLTSTTLNNACAENSGRPGYGIVLDMSHSHSGTTGSVWEKYGSANTGGMSANSSHSHTVNGGGNGMASGDAHENMPPYITKYCWERTA